MRPVRFCASVVLTDRDAFVALEACADAERALLRSGHAAEAAAVAALFELLEDRLTYGAGSPDPPAEAGSKSSESEFTQ